jgi:hypothetical protein
MNIWAAAGDDKGIEYGGESKVEITGSEEGKFAGNLVLQHAEPALLFAFVSNHRRDDSSEVEVTPDGKALHHVLQSSKDKIGEIGGENDRGIKVGDREVIPARKDGRNIEVLEGHIGAQFMQLFLLKSIVSQAR